MIDTDPSALDIATHLHAFTDLSHHEKTGPHVIDSGHGIYLVDSDGKTYIDGMSSLWCCSLGYSNQRLMDAAATQFQRLPYSHTFRGRSHPKLIELSDKLVKLAPENLTKAFFANSGSEANESAIKIAWAYHHARSNPTKRKIIARQGGYHGSTIMTACLSGLPSMHSGFNMPMSDVLFAECPHYFHGGQETETEIDFCDRLIKDLEGLIQTEGAENIAAFIAEPVMGVGGVIVPPEGYFPKVQELLRKHDILFIADEVICGFGRTGNMFGSDTFSIQPDLLSCAKCLSSAYFPISALLISDSVYQTLLQQSRELGVFSHGMTYSGHPVGAAIALEVLKIYEETDICQHVKTVAKKFWQELQSFSEHPLVLEMRAVGLMGAIEFVPQNATQAGFSGSSSIAEQVMLNAEANGLFVRASGQSLLMAPPLIITESEITEMFARLRISIDGLKLKL